MKPFLPALLTLAGCGALSAAQLMYVGTLDKKLLVIDEEKQAVVDEIALGGIPRTTALSLDNKTLYILSTQMLLEMVDLKTRKIVSSFNLGDERNKPRRATGLVPDPTGRYIYTTMRVVIKDIDQYRIDAPVFVALDVQEKKIAKTWPFPKGMEQGFGNGTYKVSQDGKLLYVFQENILVFDLATFTQVDTIELAQPPFPGASPYRLTANADPFDEPNKVTSVFTAVDSIVHKPTLGMATIDLSTRKVDYFPIGPVLPMTGFQLSPDKKWGYSVMPTGVGGNRSTEWWLWDLANHKVVKKQDFDTRPTFKFAVGGDGSKLYLYGAGPTLEIWDAKTLTSLKLIDLKKDTTTNLITLPPTE
jgi:hypothetical protein